MTRPLRVLAWPAFRAKLSPYNALLYRSMQQLGVTVEELAPRTVLKRCDVLHLHWPEYCVNGRGTVSALFWSCGLLLAVAWVRARGGKVIWTVHNLESHSQQRPRAERRFWRAFTASLNGYICLTGEGRQRALERFPALRRVPGFVIPHGNLREAYPGNEISRADARLRLGIRESAKVVGFFGAVHLYKGVLELAEAFTATSDPDAVLLIAGKSCLAANDRSRLERLAAADARIMLRLQYVPAPGVAACIRATDLVALPFREILNSGSAVLALSLDRPVLVPAKGSMPELQTLAGADWVRLYEGWLTPERLHAELDRALAAAGARGRCRFFERGWDGLGWRELAQMTLGAYDSLLQPRRRSAGAGSATGYTQNGGPLDAIRRDEA